MKQITLLLISMTLAVGALFAQTVQVSGVVTDADGQPLPGVSVVVKGTNVTVATDANGRYTIGVTSDATLVFSSIGMKTQEEAVAGRTTINVVLETGTVRLDDVVVIGYGTGRTLGSTVGTVAKVSSEKLVNKPSANVVDALQGKVAGLQIYTSSGEPSATSSIRLHGRGSLGASSTPLIILDGVPVEAGTVLGMNPNDFESVTVLKDASATSIYGARGANGVIYYTTKRGTVGENAVITARAQYGVSSLASTYFYDRLMNTQQLTDYYVATGNYTQPEVDQLLATYPNDTKWGDWFFESGAPTYQADLSVRGGGGKTTYFVSGGLFDQTGLAPRSWYKRYNLRANLDTKANNWLRLGLNVGGYYDEVSSAVGMEGAYTNGGLHYLALPYYTPYNPDGSEADYIDGFNYWNMKYLADNQKNVSGTGEILASGYVEITPLEGLTIKSQVGLDVADTRSTLKHYPSRKDRQGVGYVSEVFTRGLRSIITNTIEYKFDIKDDHAITLLAGQEGIDYHYDRFDATTTGQSDDRLMLLQHGKTTTAVNSSTTATYFTEYAFLSFFGRADYGYKDKYFADFSIRNDRSSRFGQDERSATFLSGGAMWDIKKEDFLQGVDWLSGLNLRASIGSSGNAEIGNYTHLALVGNYTAPYHQNSGRGISNPGNSHLTWEKQVKTTITLKAEFWEKLGVELSYYNRNTSNMLMSVPYPYTSGFDEITSNVGKLRNQGIDVTIDWEIFNTKDYFLTFSTVFNYNKMKVVELFNGLSEWTVPNTGITYVVGETIHFYYPIRAGIDPADGKQMWYLPGNSIHETTKDQTTKTFNSNLLQNTGKDRYPPIAGGFSLNGGWKGFSLTADFSYVLGKYLINNDRYFSENPARFLGQLNQTQDILDYWKKPGDVTSFPAAGELLEFDDHLVEDASFLRLKVLTLAYTLPTAWLNKTKVVKGVKLYVTGRNLFTLTKYSGLDPEIDSNLSSGAYPNTRQIAGGIEITF
jgi:TonB-linked SusC/RagA family outer membrane protein